MGCAESTVQDDIVHETSPMTIAECHSSLVDFVRALSEPTIRRPSSELPKNAKQKGFNTIFSVEDLTPLQEEYLSRYKMRVYGCSSDPVLRASTFNIIENEFYNTYHKQVDRKVLYNLYGIR